jgi:cytochrome c oxidase assembly protein subunit 15
VAHLLLALLIFGIAVWTAAALGRRRGEGSLRAPRSVRIPVLLLTIAVVVTMMSGGFVAGLDAGRIFNEFPLMGGQLVPDGYNAVSGLRNWFENPIAAQFNHRVLAVMLALATWVPWLIAERKWAANLRRWMRWAAVVALLQVSLGITTLLSGAPVGIAMLHQLGAVALLMVMLLASVEAIDARA